MQRFENPEKKLVESNLQTNLMEDLARRSEALRGYL
jgi:hypothetical protein